MLRVLPPSRPRMRTTTTTTSTTCPRLKGWAVLKEVGRLLARAQTGHPPSRRAWPRHHLMRSCPILPVAVKSPATGKGDLVPVRIVGSTMMPQQPSNRVYHRFLRGWCMHLGSTRTNRASCLGISHLGLGPLGLRWIFRLPLITVALPSRSPLCDVS